MDKNIDDVESKELFQKNQNNSLLSIVIPCYNDYSHIITAVNSAIKQSWINKEIIIVDDGSDNKTKKVLDELKSRGVKVITQLNQGPSTARNRGIEIAKGSFILVLDSDDYFEPEFCEKAVEILKREPKVNLVTCYGRWFKSEKDYQIFKPSGGNLDNYLFKNSSFGSAIFKKSRWKEVGGYDEEMKRGFEDWEFYIRLHKDGGYTYVIPEILFHYRNQPASRNAVAIKQNFALQEYIFLKHSDLYKKNFEKLLHYFRILLEKEEKEKNKIKNIIDYKIGKHFLKPIRIIKSWFN